MNYDQAAIFTKLDDELFIDVPESASALINIVGDN